MKKKNKGFTLIEILVVLGIIAILAAIVIVAVNPKRHFDSALDSARNAGANSIVNTVGQFIVGEKGTLPTNLPTVGDPAVAISALLCGELIPAYSGTLPTDPDSYHEGKAITNCADLSNASGYTIEQPTAGQIVVCSAIDTSVCAAI